MLIVLPPSETKAPGGESDGLDVSFSSLDPIRQEIMEDLAALDVDEMMAALKLPATKREEAEENRALMRAPVMPAIYRYTGVLYDALDAATLTDPAVSRIAIGSALFGVVMGSDTIPRYRLSGGSKLPVRQTDAAAQKNSIPTMKKRWGSAITDVLQEQDFVVDMRSGAYQQLGPVPGAVTVRVESVQEDGSRKVVSHFNKHYKGELARVLASAPDADSVTDIQGVAAIAEAAGMTVEISGRELTLVV
ncbi:peroxide stress protein YaaA [Corynebacterium sp. CCUG 69979]|uniref:peroxide stress protein YaaA n=1 Tax=Corynebacterium sp. CCUG 69979 TaxID=2823890 RepID=UPI002108FF65|nr:peroxide stress protein YaaA [Corynebacterium sp. CCUG 69979]MCQ4617971.1 peroxide stress protein YaaA [Corynebacterium pseudogenitalium]MCQ4624834.1 peroxide stress protein YaaA [Corynebacterium sp. CCUG 69979]